MSEGIVVPAAAAWSPSVEPSLGSSSSSTLSSSSIRKEDFSTNHLGVCVNGNGNAEHGQRDKAFNLPAAAAIVGPTSPSHGGSTDLPNPASFPVSSSSSLSSTNEDQGAVKYPPEPAAGRFLQEEVNSSQQHQQQQQAPSPVQAAAAATAGSSNAVQKEDHMGSSMNAAAANADGSGGEDEDEMVITTDEEGGEHEEVEEERFPPTTEAAAAAAAASSASSNSGKEGRWSKEEHQRFLEGYEKYGKSWKDIAVLVQTRTSEQIRTHAQKYFQKQLVDTKKRTKPSFESKRMKVDMVSPMPFNSHHPAAATAAAALPPHHRAMMMPPHLHHLHGPPPMIFMPFNHQYPPHPGMPLHHPPHQMLAHTPFGFPPPPLMHGPGAFHHHLLHSPPLPHQLSTHHQPHPFPPQSHYHQQDPLLPSPGALGTPFPFTLGSAAPDQVMPQLPLVDPPRSNGGQGGGLPGGGQGMSIGPNSLPPSASYVSQPSPQAGDQSNHEKEGEQEEEAEEAAAVSSNKVEEKEDAAVSKMEAVSSPTPSSPVVDSCSSSSSSAGVEEETPAAAQAETTAESETSKEEVPAPASTSKSPSLSPFLPPSSSATTAEAAAVVRPRSVSEASGKSLALSALIKELEEQHDEEGAQREEKEMDGENSCCPSVRSSRGYAVKYRRGPGGYRTIIESDEEGSEEGGEGGGSRKKREVLLNDENGGMYYDEDEELIMASSRGGAVGDCDSGSDEAGRVRGGSLSSSYSSKRRGQSKGREGRWTREEHLAFLRGYQKYGKAWKEVAKEVGTRSAEQIRTHAQKYLQPKSGSNGGRSLSGGGGSTGSNGSWPSDQEDDDYSYDGDGRSESTNGSFPRPQQPAAAATKRRATVGSPDDLEEMSVGSMSSSTSNKPRKVGVVRQRAQSVGDKNRGMMISPRAAGQFASSPGLLEGSNGRVGATEEEMEIDDDEIMSQASIMTSLSKGTSNQQQQQQVAGHPPYYHQQQHQPHPAMDVRVPMQPRPAGATGHNSNSNYVTAAAGGGGEVKEGRWTKEEHCAFLEGLRRYGKSWKEIQTLVKTRTSDQIRTHAQKYFIKLNKYNIGHEPSGLIIG